VSSRYSPLKLDLYDQMGKLIAYGHDKLSDLRELPVGIYFLQIHVGHNLFVKKMLKVDGGF
jgi:hypothetical protein